MTIPPTPTKQPFASITLSVGDADGDGNVDVAAHLRIGALELPPLVVNMAATRALAFILNLFRDIKSDAA